jgi:hypothetical protein
MMPLWDIVSSTIRKHLNFGSSAKLHAETHFALGSLLGGSARNSSNSSPHGLTSKPTSL